MTRELKIGAILGVFVVALGAWFYYSQTPGDESKPIRLDQPLAAASDKSDAQDRPAVKPDQVVTKSPPGGPETKSIPPNRTVGGRAPRTATPQPGADRPIPHSNSEEEGSTGTTSPLNLARREDGRTTPQPVVRRKPLGEQRPGSDAPPDRVRTLPPVARPGGSTAPQEGKALLASTATTPPDQEVASEPAAGASEKAPATSSKRAASPPPGSAGRAPVLPPQPTAQPQPVRKHTVVSGESFARVAERYYGSQRYMSFLIKANPQIKNPSHLKIGDVLNVPPLSETGDSPRQRQTAALKPDPNLRTYVVRQNDTFYDIAAAELGDGGRWPEIYERNKDEVGDDPGNLRVGMLLTLPPK